MMKNVFWTEALKGGTIIGLIASAFQLLRTYAIANEINALKTIMAVMTLMVFVALLYGFTRRFSMTHGGEQGFSYGNGMAFILAMMIFTGVVVGVCTALSNKFMFQDYVIGVIDEAMVQVQDVVADDVFDQTYEMTRKMLFNPIAQVFSNIFSYIIYGGFVGLIVCSFTKRDPEWTATEENNEEQNDNE